MTVLPTPTLQTRAAVRIVKLCVQPGDSFAADDVLAVLECRKTEYPLRAGAAGTLVEWLAAEGACVSPGTPLAHLGDPPEAGTLKLDAPLATAAPAPDEGAVLSRFAFDPEPGDEDDLLDVDDLLADDDPEGLA